MISNPMNAPPAGDLGPERPSAPHRDDGLAPGVPLAEIVEGLRGHPSAGGAQDGLVDLDLVGAQDLGVVGFEAAWGQSEDRVPRSEL